MACSGHVVGKMSKDIGMGVCKGTWCRSFLPCLVAFWGFHPYMSFHVSFVTCFSCFSCSVSGHMLHSTYCRAVARMSGKAILFLQTHLHRVEMMYDVTVKV